MSTQQQELLTLSSPRLRGSGRSLRSAVVEGWAASALPPHVLDTRDRRAQLEAPLALHQEAQRGIERAAGAELVVAPHLLVAAIGAGQQLLRDPDVAVDDLGMRRVAAVHGDERILVLADAFDRVAEHRLLVAHR